MANLRDIINAATPGQWWVMEGTFAKYLDPKSATVYATNDDLTYVCRCDGSQPMFHDNSSVGIPDARYIAAYSPDHALLIEAFIDAFVADEEQQTTLSEVRVYTAFNALAAYRKDHGLDG